MNLFRFSMTILFLVSNTQYLISMEQDRPEGSVLDQDLKEYLRYPEGTVFSEDKESKITALLERELKEFFYKEFTSDEPKGKPDKYDEWCQKFAIAVLYLDCGYHKPSVNLRAAFFPSKRPLEKTVFLPKIKTVPVVVKPEVIASEKISPPGDRQKGVDMLNEIINSTAPVWIRYAAELELFRFNITASKNKDAYINQFFKNLRDKIMLDNLSRQTVNPRAQELAKAIIVFLKQKEAQLKMEELRKFFDKSFTENKNGGEPKEYDKWCQKLAEACLYLNLEYYTSSSLSKIFFPPNRAEGIRILNEIIKSQSVSDWVKIAANFELLKFIIYVTEKKDIKDNAAKILGIVNNEDGIIKLLGKLGGQSINTKVQDEANSILLSLLKISKSRTLSNEK